MKVPQSFKKPWVLPTAVGVGSFGLGIVTGAWLALKRLDYIEAEEERRREQMVAIEEIRADFKARQNDITDLDRENFSREMAESKARVEARDAKEAETPVPDDMPPDPRDESPMRELLQQDELPLVDGNIFANELPGWDYDAELAKRSPENPYVIHRDEYFNEEMEGYTQITLTYYEADDVLTDEDDTPIYDTRNIVGDLVFGHGSGDPNVLYVRNMKLETEYEILRHTSSYTKEILGIVAEDEAEVEHPKVMKFRDQDE